MNFKKNKLWENIWLITAVLAVIIISILYSKDPLIIIGAIVGVIYSIGTANEDRFAYLFGIVNAILYGIVSLLSGYTQGLF